MADPVSARADADEGELRALAGSVEDVTLEEFGRQSVCRRPARSRSDLQLACKLVGDMERRRHSGSIYGGSCVLPRTRRGRWRHGPYRSGLYRSISIPAGSG